MVRAAQGRADEVGGRVGLGQNRFLDGAGLAEQVALAHGDVEFEDVDDLALALAFLGDQLDAVTAGEAGEVGGGDVAQGGQGRGAVEVEQLFDQQVGRHLHELHV